MSMFSVLSSWVMVLDEEDGETSWRLFNLPMVDCSSVNVMRASSIVSAMYGLSVLLRLFFVDFINLSLIRFGRNVNLINSSGFLSRFWRGDP